MRGVVEIIAHPSFKSQVAFCARLKTDTTNPAQKVTTARVLKTFPVCKGTNFLKGERLDVLAVEVVDV